MNMIMKTIAYIFSVIAFITILATNLNTAQADEMPRLITFMAVDGRASSSSAPAGRIAQATPTTAAEPMRLAVHGSFFERYRDDANHNNGGVTSQGLVTFGYVRADYAFAANLAAYARVGGEGITQGGQGRDYNGSYYQGTHGFRGALAVDQFGITYANAARGLTIVAGRQDKPLDATSTLYDQSWKVGRYSFLDGVSITQKLGRASVEADAFSRDQYVTVGGIGKSTRSGLYALRGTYDATSAFKVGATISRFQSSVASQSTGVASTSNYEGDITWQALPSLQLKAEYGRSDASNRNELWFGSARYNITPRDSVTALGYKIGQNADMGQGTAYPNNNRGARYFYEHDFSSRVAIVFYHEADHQLYGPGSSTSDQVTVSYGF